jgi:hypothetical protein
MFNNSHTIGLKSKHYKTTLMHPTHGELFNDTKCMTGNCVLGDLSMRNKTNKLRSLIDQYTPPTVHLWWDKFAQEAAQTVMRVEKSLMVVLVLIPPKLTSPMSLDLWRMSVWMTYFCLNFDYVLK